MKWATLKPHAITAFIALAVVVAVLLVVTTTNDDGSRRLKANLYKDGEKKKTA